MMELNDRDVSNLICAKLMHAKYTELTFLIGIIYKKKICINVNDGAEKHYQLNLC